MASFSRSGSSQSEKSTDTEQTAKNGSGGGSGRSTYKRAAERPPAVVARRNARERGRVQQVNTAFDRLRRHLPHLQQRQKRVAKLKILRVAIDYIYQLQDAIEDAERLAVLRYKMSEQRNSLLATISKPPVPIISATQKTDQIEINQSDHAAIDRPVPLSQPYTYEYAAAAAMKNIAVASNSIQTNEAAQLRKQQQKFLSIFQQHHHQPSGSMTNTSFLSPQSQFGDAFQKSPQQQLPMLIPDDEYRPGMMNVYGQNQLQHCYDNECIPGFYSSVGGCSGGDITGMVNAQNSVYNNATSTQQQLTSLNHHHHQHAAAKFTNMYLLQQSAEADHARTMEELHISTPTNHHNPPSIQHGNINNTDENNAILSSSNATQQLYNTQNYSATAQYGHQQFERANNAVMAYDFGHYAVATNEKAAMQR